MAPPLILIGPQPIHRCPSSTTYNGLINPSPPISPPENHFSTSKPHKNPSIDLFFYKPDYLPILPELLKRAYNYKPLIALKLICNLRFTAGNEELFSALVWLHHNHPLTLACNLRILNKFGSLKDLLQILVRILESEEGESEIKHKLEKGKKANDIARAKRAVEMYKSDSNYRFLHNQISHFFADLLKSDLRFLNSGEIEKISPASRFCPSLDSFFDKSTLICEGIARKLFPRESDISCRDNREEISDAHYAFRVRDCLRKQVLVPLRKALDSATSISESENQKLILEKKGKKLFRIYQRNYRNLFSDDDNERLRVYLEVADMYYKKGTVRDLPHQIVASLNDKQSHDDITELRWTKLVENVSKKGQWKNSIAICGFSKRMKDAQIDFSIAMALIISDLNRDPWKSRVLTYSINPELRKIEGENLRSRVNFMKQLKCSKNIPFSKVFDKVFDELLRVAVKEKVSEQGMVKRMYVFTDMGFDKDTINFRESARSYRSKGFTELPEIVFWNLREGGTGTAPEVQRHKGLVMVKGISERTVAILLEKWIILTPKCVARTTAGVAPTPEEVMNLAICRDQYNELVVFD